MTTIKLFDGDLGSEIMLVRCDLSQAAAPIQVDYCTERGNRPSGWQGTQYQCADARHSTSGLVRIGQRLAAVAVEVSEDDFGCEWEDISNLVEMADMLRGHGGRFTGNNVDDEAQGWLDQDFTAAEADEWCEIGVWDAATAAVLRGSEVTPAQAKDAAEQLIEDAGDEAGDLYTDGDPIYSVCNGDTSVDVLIAD